jgi:lipoate-protein ligase A
VGRSEYKVPGGKLLRAKASSEGGRITFLQVSGDFFMNPETDLEELEKELLGGPSEEKAIGVAVKIFFDSRGTVIAGASPDDFVKIIVEALSH